MLKTTPKRLVRHSYRMVFLIGMLSILMTAGMLVVLTDRIDKRAASDTRERLSLVMTEWQAALQLAVEDYAYWTFAYDVIASGDEDAVNDNIGTGATESRLFDWIAILDASGSVQYAFNFPETVGVESVFGNGNAALLLSRLAEREPLEYIAVSGAASLGQNLTLLSAAWVTPDGLAGADPAELPVLVGGVTLSPERLTRLQQATNAVQIDIAKGPSAGGEIVYALDGPFGVAGHLSLRPQTPGSDFRADVLPWLVAFSAAVILITILVAAYFRQLASQLDRAIVLASTDPLTGLANRAALQSLIETPLIRRALEKGDIAVLNIDLDRFKQLNDRHGHAVGDLALQIAAQRLQHAVRQTDHVARLGGDEFICLIVGRNPRDAAGKIAERIITLFEDPIDFGSFECVVQASIGVAVCRTGERWDALLKRADAAMYLAKKTGDAKALFHPMGDVTPRLA